jgi:tetratricopeptide (TPR) repeat protein
MKPFLGREADLKILNGLMANHDVVSITGEYGVGKSSLAQHFYDSGWVYSMGFHKHIMLDATYSNNWNDIILAMGRAFKENFATLTRLTQIEEAVKQFIIENQVLVFIDNSDHLKEELKTLIFDIADKSKKGSKFLITSISSPFSLPLHERYAIFELKGFPPESSDIYRKLLGIGLSKILDDNEMWVRLNSINGNPRKLSYIAMEKPETADELNKIIVKMERGKFDEDVVKKKLDTVDRVTPIGYYVALGRIQALIFEQDILAFLWDRLNCGNTQAFIKSQKILADKGLLDILPKWKFKLDSANHIVLTKYSADYFMGKQLDCIDYFVSEYYKDLFLSSKEGFNLEALGHYVFHSVKVKNYESAYSFVFDGNILETAHRLERAFELLPVIEHFHTEWKERLNNTKEDDPVLPRIIEQYMMIQTEMGRIYKDLSQYDDCIKILNLANNQLNTLYSNTLEPDRQSRLQRKIWHYLGIAYSQVGRTKKCIDHYSYVIEDATAKKETEFTCLDALSMGYLSYELKFHNMKKADEVGEAANMLCEKINAPDIKIKNLCGLAQIKIFMNNIEASEEYFEEAEKLLKETDTDYRELGRIMINSVVTYIYLEKWDEVERRLQNAFRIYEKCGDERRKAMGVAYNGIMLFRRRKRHEGSEKIKQAFKQHKTIKAHREIIYEALTYIWMLDPHLLNDIVNLVNSGDKDKIKNYFEENKISQLSNIPQEMTDYLCETMNTERTIFIDFWLKYYRPILLNETKIPRK